ncbi:MAG TPA: DMT family transporter [Chitinophagaceae bacterium]|nr:DMT family transporter [Chitinophagaceae bacterium]
MKTNHTLIKWGLFFVLSFIWGSSFELMKMGLFENHDLSKPILTSWQVAAIRLVAAGLVVIPFIGFAIKRVAANKLGYVSLSGILGSFFPAFLFTIAETKIDGAFAGALNSLTPVFVILVAFLFFRKKIATKAYMGIGIALLGSAILFYFTWKSRDGSSLGSIDFAWFCVLATAFYGLNVNMVNKVLKNTHPVAIGVVAFASLLIPSGIVLYFTGYFNLPLGESKYVIATVASIVLGIFGTTIASVLFYYLMQKGGYLFASMVTYGIPFIAQFWGWVNGEHVDIYRIIGLFVILGGIYLATQVKKEEQ